MKEIQDFESSEQIIDLLQYATHEELLSLTRVLEMPSVMAHKASARQIVETMEEVSCSTISSLFRKGRGIPYWAIVWDVAQHLKVALPEKGHRWVYENTSRVEALIFEKVFQHFVNSLSDGQRANLEEQIAQMAEKSDKRSQKVVHSFAVMTVAGIGSAQMVPLLGGFSAILGPMVGPLGLIALGGYAAMKAGQGKYRKELSCVCIFASIRQRLEKKEEKEVSYDLHEAVGGIRVKNGF